MTDEHLLPQHVSALVDGELSPPEAHAANEHLAACHACTLRVLEATRLKAATASAGQRFAAPPDALARLASQLRPQEPTKKPTRIYTFPAARWLALAACLLVAAGLAVRLETGGQSDELLDHHLAAISNGAPPEVISSDRHTVKPWFQGKLPFSFNLPETLPPDTVLKGGDLAYISGKPAAMLLFTVHKHEVSVFLTQRSTPLTLPRRPGGESGFSIQAATTPELQIVGVSDLNAGELAQLVKALAEVQAAQ